MCKYQEAHRCLDEAFTLLHKIQVPPLNTLYLRCRFYLGNLYLYTNRLRQARNIFEQVVNTQRSTLSENPIHLADTLRAMGKLHGNESGYHQALPYREEALKIYQKHLPVNHPKCINALHDLAGCFEAVGWFREALEYVKQALSLVNSCVTDDHSSRAKILRTIGINEQALGNWEVAFSHYCRAYSIWMLQFPEGHVFTAFCLNKIGEVYRARRQYHEAFGCQLYALEMRTRLFPVGTPQPCHSIGLTYLDIGDANKAVKTLQVACDYWRKKTPDRSNIYLNYVESCLATAYSHQGQLQIANKIFKRVLSLQQQIHPDGNPDIGFTLHHMASNSIRMRKYDRARQYYEASLDMLLKFFEKDHFEIMAVRQKMATLECIINEL